jgi:hypothetical protein
MGQFVGFSDEHSSLVANVRHLTTNFISPQFHLVFDDLFETVNRIGVDDLVIESICDELFQLNRGLFAEEELNEAGNIIYQPPPLHEVWLDDAGRRQGNEDRICQRRRNDDLMRECNRAVKRVIATPVTTGPVPKNNPNLLPISEDGSVDSSLNTQDSESEGGIRDNYDDDNVSNAPEGAQLIPHDNDDNAGTPIIGSPVGSPVGRRNDQDNLPINIVPAPIQALREQIVDIVVK